MENYGIPLASELLPDEATEALANWAKLPENKQSLERIGESIRSLNDITDGSGLLIDFPKFMPHMSSHDIECVLCILTSSGYKIDHVIGYRMEGDQRQPVVNIRVSWHNPYQPI